MKGMPTISTDVMHEALFIQLKIVHSCKSFWYF